MTDLSKIADQFASIVGAELDKRHDKDAEAKARAELVATILAKSLLHLPDDLMVVVGCGRSAAYQLIAHPRFCSTFTVVRQKMCWTEDLIACLPLLAKEDKS